MNTTPHTPSQPANAAAPDIRRIVRKAVAIGRREAGPRGREGILRILSTQHSCTRYKIRCVEKFNTASWGMWRDELGPFHGITIGVDTPSTCVDRIRTHPRKLQRFCESLLRHEAAHGLFTTADLTSIANAANQAGVPWALLNLFEDARIEHLERERSRDRVTGQPWRFHWWCFNATPKETSRPSEYFWSLINKEASSWERYSAGAPRWLGKPGADARIRDYYYRRAIHASKTADLIPLCAEWRNEFPPPPKPPHIA